MNKVIMLGRLTKEPEVRYLNESGTAVASFGLAVNGRRKKDGEYETDFFDCTAFGKLAETIEKYVKKGHRILIAGRLKNNNYTDRDGRKVYRTGIIIEELDFCESRRQEDAKPAADSNGFMNIPDDDDDIPFNF